MSRDFLSAWLLLMAWVPCIASQSTGAHSSHSSPASAQERAAIMAVLSSYETALNSANAEQASSLYADDAVLMAPGQESIVGIENIRKTYLKGSQGLRFNVTFKMIEVVPMSPAWAFARTSSEGTITVIPSEVPSAEANQELFIFHKIGSSWKIARYSFSSTKDPRAEK